VTVPAVVLIEWRRAGFSRRHSELIAPMNIQPTTPRIAKAAGTALTSHTSASVVDAAVMASAALRGDVVFSSGIGDLIRLQPNFPSVRLFGAFPADQLTRPEHRRARTPRRLGRFRLIDARHARSFAVGKRAGKGGRLHGAGLDAGGQLQACATAPQLATRQ
jgi:hypothetical protein